MKIIYNSPQDAVNFDIDRYYKSLNLYGKVELEDIEEALKELRYDPMHVSVLVELGVNLLDEEAAKEYYAAHQIVSYNFERLRRITGYLVGSLERWNDGKRAEESDRVKHSTYSQENKSLIEEQKAENLENTINSGTGKA